MAVAGLLAAWIAALATVGLTVAAWVQLPLISRQVRDLSEQIRLSREAEANAERRVREWETLKACERYDSDPILDAATLRIWVASGQGTDYRAPGIDKRDVICLINYLDGLATGIAQNLYIEAVIKDHMSDVFRHAVENFVHTKLIDSSGIDQVLKLYDRWFAANRATAYRFGAPSSPAA